MVATSRALRVAAPQRDVGDGRYLLRFSVVPDTGELITRPWAIGLARHHPLDGLNDVIEPPTAARTFSRADLPKPYRTSELVQHSRSSAVRVLRCVSRMTPELSGLNG